MPIGQVQSNSSLVGTLVLDTKSLNNTGISDRQIKPLDLGGQPSGANVAPPQQGKFSAAIDSASFKTGLSAGKISTLEQVSKPGENLSVAPPKQESNSTDRSLELTPSVQTYNFVGKLTSEASLASTGSILNAVA